tara:strand:- start:146 stop:712 length:567 start_codon:yes stop_codon:yes gene_type:complete
MKIVRPETEFWLQDKLDKEMMDYLWSQIKLAREDRKPKLVGHISRSLVLPDNENKFAPYLLNLAKNLDFTYHPNLQVRDLWVNFQKKHEFNPMHNHHGAISFVLWMKIPYERSHEASTIPTKSLATPNKSGCFQFIYTSMLGIVATYSYYLDPTWEGTLVMFPAQLEHQVYPFYTSDLDRISISGNIF